MKNKNLIDVSEDQVQSYSDLGYNDDLVPNTKSNRSWTNFNYFTLWMGSVHNVPNYVAVGGFLFLGLSPINVMIAIILSSLAVAAMMVLNGKPGYKYGIPFSMLLKSSYGEKGAKLPGVLRGCIAAIMWYGLQTYAGSQALLILIGKLFPGFLDIGNGTEILGITIPGLITFTMFWILNLLIGLGGGDTLNKFTAILNPMIYIVFLSMTFWAIKMAGGISPILAFETNVATSNGSLMIYLMIISSILSVWAAPIVSSSDFSRNAKSFDGQAKGQVFGLILSYIIFAFSSVCILIGASIHYNTETWNVLDIINKWDSLFASAFATLVLLMTTISTNATGNIIPAGYQLSSLFPDKIDFRKGVIIASIISFIICPWKLMENSDSIYAFLDIIGAIIGPIAGVMMAHFYVVEKQEIDLDELYDKDNTRYKNGINNTAFIVTLIAALAPFIGKIIAPLEFLSALSWIVGFLVAFVLYSILSRKNYS